MKKVLAITIMAAMLLTIGVVAMADTTNWVMSIKASDSAGSSSGSTASIGWRAGYTNGLDTGETAPISDPPAGGKLAYVVSEIVPGTLTKVDFRSSAGTDAAAKVWTLKVFYKGTAIDPIKLVFNNTTATFPYAGGWQYTITGAGVDYKFDSANQMATGFVINVPGAPTFEQPFVLTLTASTVVTPEPSSMVALASGLFGLVGFGIRRRK